MFSTLVTAATRKEGTIRAATTRKNTGRKDIMTRVTVTRTTRASSPRKARKIITDIMRNTARRELKRALKAMGIVLGVGNTEGVGEGVVMEVEDTTNEILATFVSHATPDRNIISDYQSVTSIFFIYISVYAQFSSSYTSLCFN
ncbi:hypothetical protein B566_EDAN004798 [Ephemera danica]|nr:hypothetical protein B566_EDAN004798 [Ephemera danica]